MTDYALFLWTTDGLPGLEDVARHLGIEADDLDRGFGVVPIQPLDDGRWRVAVRVDQRRTPELRDLDQLEGPFADPPIEPQ